jgi:DNA-binding MarR family transcriptional regulator
MSVDRVDTSYLETLVGYNARRAAVSIIEVFLQRMAVHGLRPVDFSVMSLIFHNPGITSRQLCTTLGILPPNLVGMVSAFEKRGLILRERHARDGRAMSLYATAAGKTLMQQVDQTRRLTAAERRTLMRLLQKIYL